MMYRLDLQSQRGILLQHIRKTPEAKSMVQSIEEITDIKAIIVLTA